MASEKQKQKMASEKQKQKMASEKQNKELKNIPVPRGWKIVRKKKSNHKKGRVHFF